jgi:hypothetical protein
VAPEWVAVREAVDEWRFREVGNTVARLKIVSGPHLRSTLSFALRVRC